MAQSELRSCGMALVVVAACGFSPTTTAETVVAAGCDQAAVQKTISKAADGDVVEVPAGDCSWDSFEITKGIHLRGAGSDATSIVITGPITLSKSARHSLELSGFTFTMDREAAGRMFYVDGPWDAEPPLIHDNVFDISDPRYTDHNAGILGYETNGGIIYRNVFRGNLDDSGIQHKLNEDNAEGESWAVADTMGIRDTDGKRNLYVEDNVFEGMANQATDFDDGARVVFRRNTLRSSSFNTHGLATAPVGVRHYEIYGNFFTYPDNMINQNWHVWLRGGTGVVYGNWFEDIKGQEWGNKREVHFSVRAVADGTPEGCCTSWPCKHQIGQNHDGDRQFLDPVRFWSNTGTLVPYINNGWEKICGQDIDDYLQDGRDFVFDTVPKRGYAPYPYPHPLRESAMRPLPPRAVVVNP